MLIDGYTKKDLIENTAEFLVAMNGYVDDGMDLVEDIWQTLYMKYGELVPTRTYIRNIINKFIF